MGFFILPNGLEISRHHGDPINLPPFSIRLGSFDGDARTLDAGSKNGGSG
jgi:hypothetical protein